MYLFKSKVTKFIITREEHRNEIKRQQRSRNRKRALNQVEIERIHNLTFCDWLRSHVSLISFICKLIQNKLVLPLIFDRVLFI
jgi:hypothetical protein